MGSSSERATFTRMTIALVSQHASPLAAPGALDAGSQNLYVAGLATALSALGHQVVVYTRRAARPAPAARRARAGGGGRTGLRLSVAVGGVALAGFLEALHRFDAEPTGIAAHCPHGTRFSLPRNRIRCGATATSTPATC